MKKLLFLASFALFLNAADVEITNPYARASIGHAPNSAVFFELENKGDKDLLLTSAKISQEIAQEAQIHTHKHEDGMMKMMRIAHLKIPAHSKISFAPGGNHIMLLNLTKPLKVGEQIELSLGFDDNSSIELKGVEVKNIMPNAHH